MNLHPSLAATLSQLGCTEDEIALLRERMMFAVTSITAKRDALNGQIATLSAQRDEAEAELATANQTVSKLLQP